MRAFSVILLAAGGSPRPGRHKLLHPYLGRTLVEHAARTALASGARQVVVVVGAEADTVRKQLRGLPVRIIENRDWSSGMSSSIRYGVAALDPDVESAVIALADQPRITPSHLRELSLRTANPDTPIAASSYDGTVGAPCAFDRSQFNRLLDLRGAAGARSLIRSELDSIAIIAFADANVGIDPPPTIWAAVIVRPLLRFESTVLDPYIARGPPALGFAPS